MLKKYNNQTKLMRYAKALNVEKKVFEIMEVIVNEDSLKARANNLSKELNISQNVIYNRFFFDAFLSRLALSSK